jgi:hypothetical protein
MDYQANGRLLFDALSVKIKGIYDSMTPTTQPMDNWLNRKFSDAFVLMAGSKIDDIEKKLAKWRESYNDKDKPANSAFLPIVLVSFAKDLVQVPSEWGLNRGIFEQVTHADDAPNQAPTFVTLFKGERRAQLTVLAADTETARGIATQLGLALCNRGAFDNKFKVLYPFQGRKYGFWATVLAQDMMATNVDIGVPNLNALVIDLTIQESIPFFKQDKDGNGYPKSWTQTDVTSGFFQDVTVEDKSK